MKPKFINGPTNYAKLKGMINGVEKEIHIFFDKHLDLDEQTECDSFNSIDISYYLYNLIKETKTSLDFFMEIGITQLEDKNYISNKREKYIKEVMKLFKYEFEEEKTNNDYGISKINPNVRLHYFDIRDHLDIYFLNQIIQCKITKYYDLFIKEQKDEYIKKIINYLNLVDEKINTLDKNTKHITKNKLSSYDKNIEKQKYYLNKIINKYEHKNIEEKLNSFLYIHGEDIKKNMNLLITNMKYAFENIFLIGKDKFNKNEFKKNIDKLGEYILMLYGLYTDVYLMRRILDKKYIKKSIIYSGGAHSVNFIFFIVKYLNFQIIKVQKSLEKDVKLLINKINDEMFAYNTNELFLLKKVNIQCIEFEPLGLDDTISAEIINQKKYGKNMILIK